MPLEPLTVKHVAACADPDTVRVTFTRHLTTAEYKALADIVVLIPADDTPEARSLHVQAIDKIRADLAWRGPTQRRQGHVVLPRALAEALLMALDNAPTTFND